MPRHPQNAARREFAAGRGRKIAAILLPCVAGAALITTVAMWVFRPSRPRTLPKVTVGFHDEIYYSHDATEQDAASLGQALKATGFFNDRGAIVILSKGTGGTVVSFALNDGGWDRPVTVLSFEEIGRRIANSIGGFPIQVRLMDAGVRVVHKELTVGKVTVGGRDEVYYYGSATQAEAESLGRALTSVGYLVGAGSSVVVSKDGATAISFVVEDGAWQLPGTVAGFETLVRKVAASVGGLPVDLRLLNSSMDVKKEVAVR